VPEGDTLHRIAARFRPALEGQTVLEVFLRDRGRVTELEGKKIEKVEAIGKHLLVHFENGFALRVHLGLKGRFAKRPLIETHSHPLVRLATAYDAFVCTNAYQAEIIRRPRLAGHAKLARLGPDLCAANADIEGATLRARFPGHAAREIGDLLLDQTVAAGIGNVYKSEVLFIERVHPRAIAGMLEPAALRRLFERASALLRANVGSWHRVTVPEDVRLETRENHYVYGRAQKRCLVCTTRIETLSQGRLARTTYYCPSCQKSVER
jgi:endonuclease-8